MLRVPRLPNLQSKIAQIATENVGRHWRDCQECWACRERRYCQDWRDRRECRPRLPIFPAENGRLHAEIEKDDEIASRDCGDCRDCRPKRPRLPGLLRVPSLPNLQSHIAEIATEIAGHDYRDFWGCWECRFYRFCSPRLSRLRRRLPCGVAGTAEIAGQESKDFRGCWECLDCRICDRDCRKYVDCRPWQRCPDRREFRQRLSGLLILTTESGRLHSEMEKIDEIAGLDCGKCRGGLQNMPRLLGLLSVPSMPKLQASIAEIATEIADCTEIADLGKGAEFPESVARDCRDYRLCRPRMGDCMTRLKKIDKIVTRDCWDCRDWGRKMPRLPGLLRVPSLPNL